MALTFQYRAARSLINDKDVVTVTAEGQVALGSRVHFRYVVEQNPVPGLNAKLMFVVEPPPTRIHVALMTPVLAIAELFVPPAYDHVIVLDAGGAHRVHISDLSSWGDSSVASHSIAVEQP